MGANFRGFYWRLKCFLFDEIDTGISGTTARAVAEKLVDISTGAQVIVITHQLTVAVMADAHVYVEKQIVHEGKKDEAVSVRVSTLDETTRLAVLSRMASGMASSDDNETIGRFVKSLCEDAQRFKNKNKKSRVQMDSALKI